MLHLLHKSSRPTINNANIVQRDRIQHLDKQVGLSVSPALHASNDLGYFGLRVAPQEYVLFHILITMTKAKSSLDA